MSDGDLIQQQQKLKEERENAQRQDALLDTGIGQLGSIEHTISQKECQLRELKQKNQEYEQEIRSNLRQLDAVNQILLMGDEHQVFLKSSENDQALRAALITRKKMLGQGLDAIRKLLQAQDNYDQAAQALDQANAQQVKAEAVVRNAQNQEQEERDRIIENFAPLFHNSPPACFSDSPPGNGQSFFQWMDITKLPHPSSTASSNHTYIS